MNSGYVYLLSEEGDNLRYKIGFTKNSTLKRIKQLQTGNSDPIVVVYTYKTLNYKKLEHMLHAYYGTKNRRLEWFDLTDDEVLGFLDKCLEFDKLIDYLKDNNPFY